MARSVNDSKLDSRAARRKLKVSGKPYFKQIDPELHLGYRKGKTGGKWVVRYYIGDRKYKIETIGIADDYDDTDKTTVLDWRQAQIEARNKFREWQSLDTDIIQKGPYTVKNAIDDYIEA